ncbi:MAG: hypothetical protein ACT6Q8_12415 [Niveispirillum sp.]|uniref:hypothetical protein n=1 Tax=Niveispirillum sp. TaxID=1917217 RepID=UPI004036E826
MIRYLPLLVLPLLLAGCQGGTGPAKQVADAAPPCSMVTQGRFVSRWIDQPDADGLRYGAAPFLVPREIASLPNSGQIDGAMSWYREDGDHGHVSLLLDRTAAVDAPRIMVPSSPAFAWRRWVEEGAMALPGGDGRPVLRHYLWQDGEGDWGNAVTALFRGGWVMGLKTTGRDRATVERLMQMALAGIRIDPGTTPFPVLDLRPTACPAPQSGPEAMRMEPGIISALSGPPEDESQFSPWSPDAPDEVCIEAELPPFARLLRRQDKAGKAIGWLVLIGDGGTAMEGLPIPAGGASLNGASTPYVLRYFGPPPDKEVVAVFDGLPNREQMLSIIRGLIPNS